MTVRFLLETSMRTWLVAVMMGCGDSSGTAPDAGTPDSTPPIPSVCGDGVAEADEPCDDGNVLDHDTCSATCMIEAAVWTLADPAGELPDIRLTPSLAFDDARDKVVLFGGEGQGTFLDDTWEWDGVAWARREPKTVPPPRRGNAVAYDTARGIVVMFGGTNLTGGLADTWEWNGTDWSLKSPEVSPPARFYHSMAYDVARGKVVVFGGIGDQVTGILGDTWEWDGLEWTPLTSSPSPPPNHGVALAYDVARSKLVLVGGYEGADETWERDGETWSLRSPATRPPARGHGGSAYLAGLGKVVLFGGSALGGGSLGDTWAWDGTDWVELAVAAPPPGRSVFGITHDAARQQLVMFGGASSNFLNETWLLQLE